MGPNQTYKLLHSKGNHKQNKRQDWEKIFANESTNKGLLSKTYKQLIQLNNKKQTTHQKMAKDLNEHVCKKDKQIANRHMKRCSALLIIREMQIKTITRYHLTPARMAITKKKQKSGGYGGKGTCPHSWWEYVGTATMENGMGVPKLKTELPYDSAIPLLGL